MKTAGFIFSFRLPSTHSTLKIACIFRIFLHRCLRLKRNPLKSDCDRRISSGMLVVTKFWHFAAFRDDYSHVILAYQITTLRIIMHTLWILLLLPSSVTSHHFHVIHHVWSLDTCDVVAFQNFAKKFHWRPENFIFVNKIDDTFSTFDVHHEIVIRLLKIVTLLFCLLRQTYC